jgi:adenylate cyclase
LQDFTAITEKLQPEEITLLLNEYFTEMSNIALAHGGTVNKFIGDAILIFFGDPETKGVAEDARACLRMAFEMQRQTAKLNARWRRKGIEHAYSVRMGINTGYCNVGNFGSDDRMDYTIIGAEANLASRLQSIAPPGRIVLSYETYMLVRNMVIAHEMEPIQVKGIAQPIIPYAVDSLLEPQESKLFNEHGSGFDFYLDPSEMDVSLVEHTTNVLNEAIQVLESSARQKSTVDSASEKPSSPRKD